MLFIKHGSNKLVPTEAGWYLYEKAQQMLASWDSVQEGLHESAQEPKGKIRVGCHTPVGETLLMQVLPKFLEKYPDIRIDLHMTNASLDVVAERFDVLINYGAPSGDAVVARKLGEDCMGAYASLDYIKKYGEPKTPEELINHRCLVYSDKATAHDEWYFAQGNQRGKVKVDGSLVLNTANSLLQMLLLGAGISMAQSWMIAPYLKNGSVKALFTDYDYLHLPFVGEDALYAIFPQRKGLPLKTRLFIDFIITEFNESIEAVRLELLKSRS